MLCQYYIGKQSLLKNNNRNNKSRLLYNKFNFFHNNYKLFSQVKDYYDLLGLRKNATEKEIKQAFFKKAKKLHPDTNPKDVQAKDKFAEVNEAYQVLSDKNKRAEYDRFGTTSGAGSQDFGDFSNIHDIFENLFGMGMKQKREGSSKYSVNTEPGNDIQVELTIKFEDTIKEYKGDIRVNTEEKCKTCSGSGVKLGTSPKNCSHCKGTGMLNRQNGFMLIQQTCPYCQGEGVNVDSCISCDGHGLVMEQKILGITIPSGIGDGMRVRIPKQGSASRSQGRRGNLFVLCYIKPHIFYERNNEDLHIKQVIPLSTAILGGTIEFPLLNGKKITYTLPAGLQNGHTEILRGKGLQNPNTGIHGHLYIHIHVDIPSTLNVKQKALIEEFKKLETFKKPLIKKPDIENIKRKIQEGQKK